MALTVIFGRTIEIQVAKVDTLQKSVTRGSIGDGISYRYVECMCQCVCVLRSGFWYRDPGVRKKPTELITTYLLLTPGIRPIMCAKSHKWQEVFPLFRICRPPGRSLAARPLAWQRQCRLVGLHHLSMLGTAGQDMTSLIRQSVNTFKILSV